MIALFTEAIASGIADVRRRNMIKTEKGNLMIIPRERRLIRVYIQVSPELVTKYWAAGGDLELIMKPIQKVFHPYRFTASHIEWSTVYAVNEQISSPARQRGN